MIARSSKSARLSGRVALLMLVLALPACQSLSSSSVVRGLSPTEEGPILGPVVPAPQLFSESTAANDDAVLTFPSHTITMPNAEAAKEELIVRVAQQVPVIAPAGERPPVLPMTLPTPTPLNGSPPVTVTPLPTISGNSLPTVTITPLPSPTTTVATPPTPPAVCNSNGNGKGSFWSRPTAIEKQPLFGDPQPRRYEWQNLPRLLGDGGRTRSLAPVPVETAGGDLRVSGSFALARRTWGRRNLRRFKERWN